MGTEKPGFTGAEGATHRVIGPSMVTRSFVLKSKQWLGVLQEPSQVVQIQANTAQILHFGNYGVNLLGILDLVGAETHEHRTRCPGDAGSRAADAPGPGTCRLCAPIAAEAEHTAAQRERRQRWANAGIWGKEVPWMPAVIESPVMPSELFQGQPSAAVWVCMRENEKLNATWFILLRCWIYTPALEGNKAAYQWRGFRGKDHLKKDTCKVGCSTREMRCLSVHKR